VTIDERVRIAGRGDPTGSAGGAGVLPRGIDWLTRSLRIAAWTVITLTAIALFFGFFPGANIYRDTSNCFGRALGALFSAHGGGGDGGCTATYVFDHTESAGGWELWAALVPVALLALLVRRRPTPALAVAWALSGFLIAIAVIASTFELDLFSEYSRQTLWPSHAVTGAVIGIYGVLALVTVVAPTTAAVRAIRRHRARRAQRPVFPRAVALP
jgi:hypothetical protein